MKRLWIMLAMLAAAAVAALGQAEPTATAEISRGTAYVGDEIVYQVVVRGARPSDRPSVAFPSSVRARDAGVSESSRQTVQMVNGRAVRVNDSSIAYQYRVTVLEPGAAEIPPAIVTLPDGRQLKTEPVRFEGLLPQLAAGFEVRLEMERTRLYLGETVRARVVWLIPESVGSFDFDTSVFDPSLLVEPAPPPPGSRNLNEFRLLGRQAYGVAEQLFEPNGRQRIRFGFDIQVTPTRAGPVEIGPVRVVFDREGGRGRVRAYAESDPVTLQVLPLPTAGRPPGFTGLIGSYELRTLASPTTVNVGDPITLRAELRGDEPMVGADDLPSLEQMPGFEAFRLSGEGWQAEPAKADGRRVFATTVRALSPDVTEVPPVRVWAFDPELGEYVAVSSDPIQLDVRAVREATLADAVVSPGGTPGTGTRGAIGPADPAFWAAPTAAEITASTGFDAREAIGRPVVVAALASGPAAVVAAGAFALARRRRGRPIERTRRAMRHAEHLTLRVGPGAGVRAAAATALGCEPRAVTLADLDRLPTHPGVIRTLRESLFPEETGRGGTEVSPRDARLAIRTLQRDVVASMRKEGA